MTWLPVDDHGRDAVLGRKPEAFARLRDVFTAARREVDPALLELCRQRLAAAIDSRHDGPAPQTELEHAAVAYAEQFHYDHIGITDEQSDALAHRLDADEFAAVVRGIWLEDAYQRVAALLDVDRQPPAPAGGFEGTLKESIGSLGRTLISTSELGDYASETIRLHNAAHQRCLF